ncbi:MAG: DUF92 domain-containing protein, partial [candidate division KSB1 bacterium]|nr:DUF92 domain-containing protein [candidate division KSB1 bacterium]
GERTKRPIVLHPGPEKKTLQGSATMFTVTLLLVTASFWVARHIKVIDLSVSQIVWIAVAVAMIAMASEMISAWGSDNLSVPLSSAFALYYLLNEPWSQALMFFLGMALAAGMAVLSYRLRFLNGGGSVALFLLGTLVFGAGGWKFALPILTFFIISSAISKMGSVRKQKLEQIFEKGSRRDIGQVLANGGIAGLMLLFWYFSKNNFFYVLYIASLAAVTADTWATEIGVMARGNPRSILTFRPVAMGTSGGISAVGTTGALLGSIMLSTVGYLCSPHASPRAFGLAEAIVVVFAGLAGSLVDSLLGATVQAQYQCPSCGKTTEKRLHCQQQPTLFFRGYRWINNDVVNAFCAVAGVLFVWLAGAMGIL